MMRAMLERLVYESRATEDFGSLHLFHLLTHSQGRNERMQITGHLLYLNGQFTQCIEGPPDRVETLWQALQRDPRHHSLELLMRRPITERVFTEWSMAFSTHASYYVHGMRGFFPVEEEGPSPLIALCST